MRNSIPLFCATAGILGALCLPANAALIAYEGFSYAPGSSLVGQSGGVGFQNAWWSTGAIASNRVDYPGTSYAGTSSHGGKLYAIGVGSGSLVAYRDLATTVGTDGTTAWLSVMAVRTGGKSSTNGVGGGATYVRAMNMALFEAPTPGSTSSQSERLSPGEGTRDTAATRPDTDCWQLLVGGSAANAATVTTTAPVDVLSLLLLRIDYGVGNADRAYMWVNPSLAAEPNIADAAATTTGNFTFNRLRPFAGNPNTSSQNIAAEGYFDEIRIGTGWMDVIPEPSALAILSLGLVGLCFRRSRP